MSQLGAVVLYYKPVVANNGITYERQAFLDSNADPNASKPWSSNVIYPNLMARGFLFDWWHSARANVIASTAAPADSTPGRVGLFQPVKTELVTTVTGSSVTICAVK